MEPAARLAALLLVVCWREAVGRIGDLAADPSRRLRRREARQLRAARATVATLGSLKGGFAKLGQFASLRVDVLSPPVRATLAQLRDQVPPRPLGEVLAVVEEELGAPLGQRFCAFEPQPLGTASIAQVHRARLRDGTPVVVKVQFPWLARSLAADLALIRLLFRLLRPGRGAEADCLASEFGRSLREELDFEREADAAEEIARNLAGLPQVIVPRVFRTHSTRRVLTTSYVPAVRITDRAALEQRGVLAADALAVLAEAYAKQVFVDGCFHADPHPGNLFVVDEPSAGERPRVLFVDFGLSKRLSPALRREIRRGLLATLQGDTGAFVAGMRRLGAIAPGAEHRVHASVAEMFEQLRGAGSPLTLPGSRVLALKARAETLLERSEGIQLPTELLLYAKTIASLFALGNELAPEVDLMRLCVPHLIRFLGEREPETPR